MPVIIAPSILTADIGHLTDQVQQAVAVLDDARRRIYAILAQD